MGQRANHPYACDETVPPESVIFGRSETMAAVRRNLLKVADTDIPILIEGESGTGKEVICKYLHQQSIWGCGPFVKVSCPAIRGTLLECELFGQESGAFTDAFAVGTGRVEKASRGTLFLDEVSELDSALQSRLLQALQDGRFRTVSSTAGKKVNVRVICATNRRLQQEVGLEHFRQDLYYRITGLVLRLPPLRERLEDLEQLAEYFVAQYNERFQCSVPPVSESTLMQMTAHPWTGNIRELENLVKRYVVVGTEQAILSEIAHREDVSRPALSTPVASSPYLSFCHQSPSHLSLGQVTRNATLLMESRMILDALRTHHGNRKLTAHALKISYRSLLYKLKKAGIQNHRQVESAGAEGRKLENQS
jgi:two-component system response regulator AtoC